jgi:uncharacterized protein YdaU (DUF1376 family)
MHYYKFNIGDYIAHTSYLDPIEDIAYRRMMDWSYLNESPLPEDVKEVARLIKMRDHVEAIKAVVSDFWTLSDRGWVQARIEHEIASYKSKEEKARSSANARWNKEVSKTKGSVDANALRTQCDGNAMAMLNTKHKTINTKQLNTKQLNTLPAPVGAGVLDALFDQFYEAYPKKVGRQEAVKAWGKLKPNVAMTQMLIADIADRIERGAWSLDERQYIPGPAPYLNGRKWTDDVIPRNGKSGDTDYAEIAKMDMEVWK